MADIDLTRDDLPFLFSGNGTITVHANVGNPKDPLPLGDTDLVSVDFGATGDQTFLFGAATALKVAISAGVKSKLMVLSAETRAAERLKLLADHGLAKFFATRPDTLLLGFTLDATADLQAGATFRYEALKVTSTIAAGVSSDLLYLRPYPKKTPAADAFKDFAGSLRLPAHLTGELPPGEVVFFTFGGYLSFGAKVAVGYQIKGAPSVAIRELQLSEHYAFSAAASVSFGAKIAGEFAVEARAVVDDAGEAKAGWVRLIVRKKRSRSLQIAADADVSLDAKPVGLPGSANEFLGALLGVRVKNWLNVVDQVRELSDWDALQKELDDLAKQFVGAWVGKAFAELKKTDLPEILARIQSVVDSYNHLEDMAITLFDRYFNQVEALTGALNKLVKLTSWDSLKAIIDEKVGVDNGTIWEIVEVLTDGDPLTWILGQITITDENGNPVHVPSLPEFVKRVQDTLDLIQKDAHDAIRKFIKLAKAEFGLDPLMAAADKLDSLPKLEAAADAKAIAFVQRLIGAGIDELRDHGKVEAIRKRLHDTLTAINDFEGKAYDKFKDALTQSYSFNLHAAYNRASDSDALLDVEINVTTPAGVALLQKAGAGECHEVLAGFRPDLVRLREGVLSHKLTKSSALTVNVLGWHAGWHYQGLDRVIIETDQHLVAESNGGLTAYTKIEMTRDRERQRQDESVKAHLVLRFLGDSHGVLKLPPGKQSGQQQYLIDAITAGSVAYALTFKDADTSLDDLRYYLSFAQALGLADKGATVDQLLPMLPPPDPANAGRFGEVSVAYQVRHTDVGLRRLFAARFDPEVARQVLRQIIWANYIRAASTTDVAWGYVFPSVQTEWRERSGPFNTREGSLQFNGGGPAPVPGLPVPATVSLNRIERGLLNTLFIVEDKVVRALMALDSMIHMTHDLDPSEFERRLSDLDSAFGDMDRLDGDINGVFAVIDKLVQLQTPAPEARLSSVTLISVVNNEKRTKVILSGT
jgi:hypothetical protein